MAYYDELNIEEITKLDQNLCAAAHLLRMRYCSIGMTVRKLAGGRYHDYYETVSAFLEHLQKQITKRYPQEKQDAIDERMSSLSQSMVDVLDVLINEYGNLVGFEVMLPVILYTLSINNGFNKATKQKAASRAKKSNEVSAAQKDEKEEREFELKHRELCTITRRIASEESKASGTGFAAGAVLAQTCKAIEDAYREIHPDVAEGFLIQINKDVNLGLFLWKKRPDLVYWEESAYIGELLRGVLEDERFGLDPLDSIISMYVYNEMDKIFMRTGIMGGISPAVYLDEETENGLLKWHFQSLAPEENIDLAQRCVSFCTKKINEFKHDCKEEAGNRCYFLGSKSTPGGDRSAECIEKEYQEIHDFLKKSYTFTADDVKLLFNFYLDNASLNRGRSLRHRALLHIKKVTKKLYAGNFNCGYDKPDKVFLKRVAEGITIQNSSEYCRKLDLYICDNLLLGSMEGSEDSDTTV